MAEPSQNSAERLQPADMDLGRSIQARYTAFAGTQGIGANVAAFLGRLPALSPIGGSSSGSALARPRSSMDHLLMRWKMGKLRPGAVSTLPVMHEAAATGSPEAKSEPGAAPNGLTTSTSGALIDGMEIAHTIHARYGSSPGMVSTGNERNVMRKRNSSPQPGSRSAGVRTSTRGNFAPGAAGSVMRKTAAKSTAEDAARGDALQLAESNAILASFHQDGTSSMMDRHMGPASSPDLPQAEGGGSVAAPTHASARSMVQPTMAQTDQRPGMVLRRPSLQQPGAEPSRIQRSADAGPLAPGSREPAFNSPTGGSVESAPFSRPAIQQPVLSTPHDSVQKKAEAGTIVHGGSAPAVDAKVVVGHGPMSKADLQLALPVQRSLAPAGEFVPSHRDAATPLIQPPILRRPGRPSAASSKIQAKSESAGPATQDNSKPPVIHGVEARGTSQDSRQINSSSAPWPATSIQRQPGKESHAEAAPDRLQLPAPWISGPERTAAPISKLVQRRPHPWKTNAGADDFRLASGHLPVSSGAALFSQVGFGRTHLSPRLPTATHAAAGEPMIFRSTLEPAGFGAGNEPQEADPGFSGVSHVPAFPGNGSPQIAEPFLPSLRVSRRGADRAGNFISSSGMIHRIQRASAPEPVAGIDMPGREISAASGMTRSVQRSVASRDMADAGAIGPAPASLRSMPETSGNPMDMTQIANRVYDLLVVRLQNERQQRGF
jgi:hypothetical protein